MRKAILLDFTGVKDLQEFWKKIRETLDFPDYFGNNLDAMWDCLREYGNDPLEVTVRGLKDLPHGFDHWTGGMRDIFRDILRICPNVHFTEEI